MRILIVLSSHWHLYRGGGAEEPIDLVCFVFFFQAEDGIRDLTVTGVQTCALPICSSRIDFNSRSLSNAALSASGSVNNSANFASTGRGEPPCLPASGSFGRVVLPRSEEHTSELQSQSNLVCRLLLEKKKS